jgi:hypothetical protein
VKFVSFITRDGGGWSFAGAGQDPALPASKHRYLCLGLYALGEDGCIYGLADDHEGERPVWLKFDLPEVTVGVDEGTS